MRVSGPVTRLALAVTVNMRETRQPTSDMHDSGPSPARPASRTDRSVSPRAQNAWCVLLGDSLVQFAARRLPHASGDQGAGAHQHSGIGVHCGCRRGRNGTPGAAPHHRIHPQGAMRPPAAPLGPPGAPRWTRLRRTRDDDSDSNARKLPIYPSLSPPPALHLGRAGDRHADDLGPGWSCRPAAGRGGVYPTLPHSRAENFRGRRDCHHHVGAIALVRNRHCGRAPVSLLLAMAMPLGPPRTTQPAQPPSPSPLLAPNPHNRPLPAVPRARSPKSAWA